MTAAKRQICRNSFLIDIIFRESKPEEVLARLKFLPDLVSYLGRYIWNESEKSIDTSSLCQYLCRASKPMFLSNGKGTPIDVDSSMVVTNVAPRLRL